MARRSLSQNLPNLVKGGCTVGAVTYQSAAARAYHDEADDASVGGVGRDSTVLTGSSTSNNSSGRAEEVVLQRGALKVAGRSATMEQASSSSSSPDRHISVQEVEEASRILFAPQGTAATAAVAHSHHHHNHHDTVASSSFRESNELLSGMSARGGGRRTAETSDSVEEEDLACKDKGSISPSTPSIFRVHRQPSPSCSSSPAVAAAAAAAASAASAVAVTPSSSVSRTTLTRLHPQPEVHAEILRFGMALANNPKIQSAIREELEMHHVHHVQQQEHLEGGREGGREGGLDSAEATVVQMESNVRRIFCQGVAGGEEEEEEEEVGRQEGSGTSGSTGSSSCSPLTGSFELLEAMSTEWAQAQAQQEDNEDGEEGKFEEEHLAENVPSNCFVSVGRNMRRKDSLAGEVSDEVLDELLRGDDDDDVIAQRLFAQTPDEQVRRYLRNLDLECVICCEYMVECKAVDCGEGHTFCGECIEQWLGREGGREGGGRCPTCQKPCGTTIPMRQYDAMIEKYVRASNLWDEQCSFYRRRTLAHIRRALERQDREEEEAAAAATAATGSQNLFAGLGYLLFGLGGSSGAGATRRRRRNRQAVAEASEAGGGGGVAGVGSARGEGGRAEDAAQPWWKSEVLSTALSVATMLVLLVLFKRGIKIR